LVPMRAMRLVPVIPPHKLRPVHFFFGPKRHCATVRVASPFVEWAFVCGLQKLGSPDDENKTGISYTVPVRARMLAVFSGLFSSSKFQRHFWYFYSYCTLCFFPNDIT
jgi:hypothetical protein